MKTTMPLQVFKSVCLALTLHVSSVETTLTCNFEDANLCGYTQDNTEDFDWTRFSGPTSSWETGPDDDHTFASSVGHYMYIEATPQNDNQVARLVSSVHTPSACAEYIFFWYHMHGVDVGTLRVYLQRAGQRGTAVFTVQGNKGNTWLLGKVSIPENSQPFQLVFEGSGGKDYRGDIGLDDVNVTVQHCYAGPLNAILSPSLIQYSVQEGSEMTNITCTCGGCVPGCDVVWSFNGTTLRNNSYLRLGTISRFSRGTYTCACKNPDSFHTKNTSFTLDIKHGPDAVVLSPNTTKYTAEEGYSIAPITCSCGQCSPNCYAEWIFKNISFRASSVLHLDEVSRNASGQYSCSCVNTDTFQNKSRIIDVIVEYGPDEATLNTNITQYFVEEGTSVPEIQCNCGVCNPACEVQWLCNGVTIEVSSGLLLHNLSRNRSGEYKCSCNNPSTGEKKFISVIINILYGPDAVFLLPNTTEYTIAEDNSIPLITCSCGLCNPNCYAQWMFKNTSIGENGILYLDNVSRNASGQYSCDCFNSDILEKKSKIIDVKVEYGPDTVVLVPSLNEYTVVEGELVPTIYCDCGRCRPACNRKWLFNNNSIETNGILQLGYAFPNTAGQYFCQCVNPDTMEEKTRMITLEVEYGPDEVYVSTNITQFSVVEGFSLPEIRCACSGCNPTCSVHWLLNGITIRNTSEMQFNNVHRNMSGEYTCRCLNPSTGFDTFQHVEIDVTYGPEAATLNTSITHYSVEEGTSVPEIQCNCGVCNPACDVQWLYNGVTTEISSGLLLHNLSRYRSGKYKCRCSNPSTGEKKFNSVIINILYGPDAVFLSPNITEYTIVEDNSIPLMECSCGLCNFNCSVQWVFKNTNIGENNILYLDDVSRNASGQYSCDCINTDTLEKKSRIINVNVEYGPDEARLSPNITKYVVEEGSSIPKINCSCGVCSPDCDVQWLFDGGIIENSSGLLLYNVSRNRSGEYKCSCSNPSTGEEKSLSVIVNIQYGPDEVKFMPDITSYSGAAGSYFGKITCTCGKCEPRCIVKWITNELYTTNSSSLEFEQLSISNTGQYMCYCINQDTAKTVTKGFQMHVQALPVQPCQNDIDEWGTLWSETVAGKLITIECKKEGYTGNISRQCSKDGKWKPPLYECIRASVAKVHEQLGMLMRMNSSNVTSVLDELVSITSVTKEKDGAMFSGELESVTEALDVVATLAHKGLPPTEEQSRSFLNTASNLLNQENKKSWSSLSQSKNQNENGAAKLLKSVDTLSGALTKGLDETNTSAVTIVQSNIVLEASKVNESQQEIVFPLPSTKQEVKPISGAKFSLPLGNSSGTTPKKYTVALYKNLAGILPNTVYSTQTNKTVDQYELNTPVLSLQVFPEQDKLYKPLELTFDLQNANYDNPICSYWNFQEKRWDSDGCHVKRLIGSSVTCECDHLTNFAVLMSPWQEPIADSTVIEIISVVGCGISIFCLFATTVLHALLWRNLKNDRAVILINICIALTATYIIFLAGINQTVNQDICTAVAALLHYILLVVFCLMLTEGIEITITVKYVFIRKSRIKWMIPLAWGVPAVVVGISLGASRLNGYGTINFCWLSVENGVIWAFVGPALLIIGVNIVFLGILLRTMLKTKAYADMSDIDRIKASTRCLCVLVPLMGCTWVLGIFYVNEGTTWIQYIFAVCNSLQGFFIFLFHGLLNKQLQAALKSRHKKYKDSHSLSKNTHSVGKVSRATEVTGMINPLFNRSVQPDLDSESTQLPESKRKKLFSSDEVVKSAAAKKLSFGWKRSWQFKKRDNFSLAQAGD